MSKESESRRRGFDGFTDGGIPELSQPKVDKSKAEKRAARTRAKKTQTEGQSNEPGVSSTKTLEDELRNIVKENGEGKTEDAQSAAAEEIESPPAPTYEDHLANALQEIRDGKTDDVDDTPKPAVENQPTPERPQAASNKHEKYIQRKEALASKKNLNSTDLAQLWNMVHNQAGKYSKSEMMIAANVLLPLYQRTPEPSTEHNRRDLAEKIKILSDTLAASSPEEKPAPEKPAAPEPQSPPQDPSGEKEKTSKNIIETATTTPQSSDSAEKQIKKLKLLESAVLDAKTPDELESAKALWHNMQDQITGSGILESGSNRDIQRLLEATDRINHLGKQRQVEISQREESKNKLTEIYGKAIAYVEKCLEDLRAGSQITLPLTVNINAYDEITRLNLQDDVLEKKLATLEKQYYDEFQALEQARQELKTSEPEVAPEPEILTEEERVKRDIGDGWENEMRSLGYAKGYNFTEMQRLIDQKKSAAVDRIYAQFKARQAEPEPLPATPESAPVTPEAEPAKVEAEPTRLSQEALKDGLMALLQEIKEVKQVKTLSIEGTDDKLRLRTTLDAGMLGGIVKLSGEIINKGNGVDLSNPNIDARVLTKRMIQGKLDDIPEKIQNYLTKKFQKPIQKLAIKDGNLEITFE